MDILFGSLTVICVIYRLVLLFYHNVSADPWIWTVFAIGFAVNTSVAGLYRKSPKSIPLWLVTSMHTVCFTVIAVFLVTGILIASRMHPEMQRGLDYLVVMGAKVEPDGTPSPSLKLRLDRAIAYADRNPATILVLSGGKGHREPKTEAESMAEYLVYNGVPHERLLLEIQAENTYENVTMSRALIGVDRVAREGKHYPMDAGRPQAGGPVKWAEERPVRIGFLTQEFHMCRTLGIAEKLYGGKVAGIYCDSDPVLFPHLCFRECIALLKDKYLDRL